LDEGIDAVYTRISPPIRLFLSAKYDLEEIVKEIFSFIFSEDYFFGQCF
jgi:hypothetical protein